MDILRTGVIACRHEPGECRRCANGIEQRCAAPTQDPQVETCSCPRPPGLHGDSLGRHWADPAGVLSHDCPIHGVPIEAEET